MSFQLTGIVTVECDNDCIVISAEDFQLEEAEDRHIGDGDYQYETLYIYFDADDRFKVLLQVTEFEGNLTVYTPTLEGSGRIVVDDLNAETIWPEDGLTD